MKNAGFPLRTFNAAVLSLKMQLLEIGETLPFPDVECDLVEDLKSAMLFVPDGRGHYLYALFDLPDPVEHEDQFDPRAFECAALDASIPAGRWR
jgi:hypothetical protein